MRELGDERCVKSIEYKTMRTMAYNTRSVNAILYTIMIGLECSFACVCVKETSIHTTNTDLSSLIVENLNAIRFMMRSARAN